MSGPEPLSDLRLPCPVDRLAIFLDFDGTLADIVEHPDDVRLPADMIDALDRLSQRTSGAVAVVTGRPIEQIDHLLSPLVLPVAGVHGMARRTFDGKLHTTRYDPEILAQVQARLMRLHTRHEDTMVETKPASVAFHYRRRPDLAGQMADLIHEVIGDMAGLDVLHGKMVVEVKAGHANKGGAIRDFMDEPPFSGRVALFAGDDVTDEFGFREVNDMGGISIKVGDGQTAALWRVEGPSAFRNWLAALATA